MNEPTTTIPTRPAPTGPIKVQPLVIDTDSIEPDFVVVAVVNGEPVHVDRNTPVSTILDFLQMEKDGAGQDGGEMLAGRWFLKQCMPPEDFELVDRRGRLTAEHWTVLGIQAVGLASGSMEPG